MFKQTFIVTLFIFALALSVAAQAVSYSATIEDLPLMSGMQENLDDVIVFDKPSGRIIEMSAFTVAPTINIQKFYQQALPSLGWQPLAPLLFTRDGETLKISIEKIGNKNLVHFNLKPISEGQ